jgi:hypothetical protein
VYSVFFDSYGIDPASGGLTEEENMYKPVKLYYIDAENNNPPLSSIISNQDVLNFTDKVNELFDHGNFDQAITYY